MPSNATATLTVKLRDLASRQFGRIGQAATSAMSTVQRSGQQASKAFNVAGSLALAAGGMQQLKGQADQLVKGPIQDFIEFEHQMERVRQLTGSLSDGEFQQLSRRAVELGETTFFTGQQAAEGLEQLAVAGFSAQEQLAAIEPVMRLAQAAGTDLGRTSDIASDLLGAFGMKAGEVGKLNDVLAATFTSSTNTLEDLFESLKLAGPIATQAGVPLEETAKLAGLLGNAGLKGSLGGTALRGALIGLSDPSKKAGKTLRKIGLDAGFIQENLKDPIKLFGTLAERLNDIDPEQRLGVLAQIFGRRQAGAVGVIVDAFSEGATGLGKLNDAIENSEGLTLRMGLAMEKTTKGKVKLLESAIAKLKLELGEQLLPTVMDLMVHVREAASGFSKWTKENPGLTSALFKSALALSAILAVAIPMTLSMSGLITLWGAARVPLVLFGKGMKKAAIQATLLNTKLKAQGTRLGAVGAAATKAGSAAVAFTVGWEIGSFVDKAIGWLFGLEGGLLSTYLATEKLGKSQGFNTFVRNIGEGMKSLGMDNAGEFFTMVAQGNQARNQTDSEVNQRAEDALRRANLEAVRVEAKAALDLNIKVDQDGRVRGAEARQRDNRGGMDLNLGEMAVP